MKRKPFKELTRDERMDELLEHVNSIMHRLLPKRELWVDYIKLDDENIKRFSDWTRERLGLLTGTEYLIISEGSHMESVLYAVNITADSELTAMDELFHLLSYKF